MRRRTEHPLIDVVVELVLGGGFGGGAPVRDVLPVAADRQSRGVTPTRVRAERRLHDGEDAVGRDLDPVPEALEVVDHPLDGRHHAAPGGPGAPNAIEQGLGEDEIARRVGGGGVDQRDVRHQGLEQSERTEG